MVVNCKKCGEYAYATRYKDSFLSFCRACGYYEDVLFEGVEKGYLDEEKFRELKERWDVTTEYTERFI